MTSVKDIITEYGSHNYDPIAMSLFGDAKKIDNRHTRKETKKKVDRQLALEASGKPGINIVGGATRIRLLEKLAKNRGKTISFHYETVPGSVTHIV